jgi:transposase-like protein
MPGNQSKLTPAVHEALVEAVKRGNYVCVACDLVGVDQSTYYKWMKEAERLIESEAPIEQATVHQQACVQLFQSIKAAESQAQDMLIAVVVGAATGPEKDWKAAMTLLERRWPKMYGRSEARLMKDEETSNKALDRMAEAIEEGIRQLNAPESVKQRARLRIKRMVKVDALDEAAD